MNPPFIIGSGDSLSALTQQESGFLNKHPRTLAMNKYILYWEKIGVVPTDIVLCDFHYPTQRVAEAIIDKNKTLPQHANLYLDEYYLRNFYAPFHHMPESLINRMKLLFKHGYIMPRMRQDGAVCLFKHAFCQYDNFHWAKNLDETLFWLHTSLLSAINLASIIYPKCDIILLGVDLNGSKSFYNDEILKTPSLLDRHFMNTAKTGVHSTVTAERNGLTIFNGLEFAKKSLNSLGVDLFSGNPQSLLAEKGLLNIRPIL